MCVVAIMFPQLKDKRRYLFIIACQHCGQAYNTMQAMSIHIKYHCPFSGDPKIKCGCCGDEYTNWPRLCDHLNQSGATKRPAFHPAWAAVVPDTPVVHSSPPAMISTAPIAQPQTMAQQPITYCIMSPRVASRPTSVTDNFNPDSFLHDMPSTSEVLSSDPMWGSLASETPPMTTGTAHGEPALDIPKIHMISDPSYSPVALPFEGYVNQLTAPSPPVVEPISPASSSEDDLIPCGQPNQSYYALTTDDDDTQILPDSLVIPDASGPLPVPSYDSVQASTSPVFKAAGNIAPRQTSHTREAGQVTLDYLTRLVSHYKHQHMQSLLQAKWAIAVLRDQSEYLVGSPSSRDITARQQFIHAGIWPASLHTAHQMTFRQLADVLIPFYEGCLNFPPP